MSPIILAFFVNFVYFLQVAKANDCDKLGVIIYEDLGCKPVFIEGQNCPVKYDCDLEVKNATCLFGKHKIPIDQQLPNDIIEGKCARNCQCVVDRLVISTGEDIFTRGKFSCGHIDCAEFLRIGLYPKQGCHLIRKLGKCCSQGLVCDTPENPIARCQVSSDVTALEGQTFNPPNTCSQCVCSKNFNGKLEEPNCRRVECAAQLNYQKEISDHCAPFYPPGQVLCCPTEWICPSENDKIVTVIPTADEKSDLKCRFGTKTLKLGEGFETKIKTSWGTKEVIAKCECILPPLLTCTEVPN